MSADNGIYIGCFPTVDGGEEYWVAEAQNIEDCQGDIPINIQDAIRVKVYCAKRKNHFLSREEAWRCARDMAEEFADNGWVLEYGVSEIRYDRPLPKLTINEAKNILEKYWNKMRGRR